MWNIIKSLATIFYYRYSGRRTTDDSRSKPEISHTTYEIARKPGKYFLQYMLFDVFYRYNISLY